MSYPVEELREIYISLLRCINCRVCSVGGRTKKYTGIGCPMYSRFKFLSHSPTGIILSARNLAEGTIRPGPELMEILSYCTACGYCVEGCWNILMLAARPLIDHVKILELLRAVCVEAGALKISALVKTLDHMRKYGNPFGVSRKEERLMWMRDLGFGIKFLPEQKASILLYMGSMYILEPLLRDTCQSIVGLLNAVSVDFGILENERDDGLLALQVGERELFREIAEENIEIFNNLGIEVIVTPDPHAYNAFKEYYPQVGKIEPKVLHITEYIEQLIKEGKIKLGELREIITYHDPCNLGRRAGIYESPRNVINAIKGIELREMERSKENAWCCGAGGGVVFAHPDFMNWVAQQRIKEAELTGASTLVTACPWCEYSFKQAIEAMKSPLKIKNIVELVKEARLKTR
ncbi:MAG: (Fe-S)-binding protein [Candidatus Bathyarchaeia archaeon]